MRTSFGGPLFCLTHHLYRPEEGKDDMRRVSWCFLELLPQSAIAHPPPQEPLLCATCLQISSTSLPPSFLPPFWATFLGTLDSQAVHVGQILIFIIIFFFLGQVIPNLYDVGINPCPFLMCHPNTSRLYKCHGMHNIYFWKHPNDFFFSGKFCLCNLCTTHGDIWISREGQQTRPGSWNIRELTC